MVPKGGEFTPNKERVVDARRGEPPEFEANRRMEQGVWKEPNALMGRRDNPSNDTQKCQRRLS